MANAIHFFVGIATAFSRAEGRRPGHADQIFSFLLLYFPLFLLVCRWKSFTRTAQQHLSDSDATKNRTRRKSLRKNPEVMKPK